MKWALFYFRFDFSESAEDSFQKRLRSLTRSSRFHKHVLSMVQMFTEEERKNKYASLYNRSTFVVASIHSLVFDTTSESAYVTKNIESHCPIVLVVSPVEQLWSWSIYVLRSGFLCRHAMLFPLYGSWFVVISN